jgi:hypothetical protein
VSDDAEVTLAGDGPLPSARKRDLSLERIQARLDTVDEVTDIVDGVLPLNTGFFRMEKLRRGEGPRVAAPRARIRE